MPNEKPNDGFYWKNKLDELENLPGESFNKEDAWNKLHQRLYSKPSKKKIGWYWAAAVLLLFILIAPFLMFHKKENITAQENTAKEQPQKTVSPSLVNNKSSVAEIVNINSPGKNNFMVNEKPDQKIHVLINKKITSKFRLAHTVSIEFEPENLTNALQPIDTIQNSIVLTTLPQKKKLKVVHINELGDAEEDPVTVRNTDIRSFQLKFANQEVFTAHSINSKAKGFTILKTKSSTN